MTVTKPFSARGIDLEMVKSGEAPPPMLIMKDPPEHRRLRGLINKAFTPRAMLAVEPLVRATVDDCLSQVDHASFDVVQDFSALFPVEIITTMLGVPAEHRQQIRRWIDKSLEREYGNIHSSVSTGTYTRLRREFKPASNPTPSITASPSSGVPSHGTT